MFESFLVEQMRRAYYICDWWWYLLCFRSPGKKRVLGNAITEPVDHYIHFCMTSKLGKQLEVTVKGKQTKKGKNNLKKNLVYTQSFDAL